MARPDANVVEAVHLTRIRSAKGFGRNPAYGLNSHSGPETDFQHQGEFNT